MRGADITQERLFTTRTTAAFVPTGHPLIAIREILNEALRALDEKFAGMYAEGGRLSVPPERLLRGLVLQALYGIRSERLLCEQLHYNMLFRWFVGMAMDEPAWDHSTYSKNRDRLIEHDAVRALFGQVVEQAGAAGLLSDEHFSVDGTLIRAWASLKSFVPKDGPPPERSGSARNPEVDFRGQRRSNDTHASTTDADARLCSKGERAGAIPAFVGNALMENRSGLAVDGEVVVGDGAAETHAGLSLLGRLRGRRRRTVGADKAYDNTPFVDGCRQLNVTPHVAQNAYTYTTASGTTARRTSRIDGRTTRHAGYRLSQTARKLIETLFGDGKQHGGTIRQVKLRGLPKVQQAFTLALLATNLRRLPRLLAAAAAPG
jgi:transposase